MRGQDPPHHGNLIGLNDFGLTGGSNVTASRRQGKSAAQGGGTLGVSVVYLVFPKKPNGKGKG